jgi:hypothetical protein
MMQATAEHVHAELERVLARGEFQEEKSLLEELLERILPRLEPEHVSLIGDALRWLLVSALIAVVVVLALRLVQRLLGRRGSRELAADGGDAGPETRVAALLARARAARAAGDLRLALRHYLVAVLQAFGGSGELEYRPTWTHRELLRRGRPSAEARALLETLVGELEAKEFGRAGVEPSDLDRLEELLLLRSGLAAGGA